MQAQENRLKKSTNLSSKVMATTVWTMFQKDYKKKKLNSKKKASLQMRSKLYSTG
jgi:hypothetical protein